MRQPLLSLLSLLPLFCSSKAKSEGWYSNGSQFFITTVPTPHLDGKHTVFGKVIEGKEYIDAIESVGSPDGTPTEKVVIVGCGSL